MSANGLSSLNAVYMANIKNNPPAVSAPETQTSYAQKEDGDKKLNKALIGLGIIGAAALGIGIFCAVKGKGKTPKNLVSTPDTSKITNTPVQTPAPAATQKPLVQQQELPVVQKTQPKQTLVPSSNQEVLKVQDSKPPVMQQEPPKALTTVERLGNGRIRIVQTIGNVQNKPIELPEYLYHITSKNCMDKITASDTLKISENEQLRGLYFLDSKNFLSHYGNTVIDGTNKDLLSAIFRQASKGNKGLPRAQQELVVIKVPTADLLKNGKIRIRTQEDFFTFTNVLKNIENKTGKKYSLRELCDDNKREEFKKLVLDNNIMSESQLNHFLKEMKIKIHYGYSLKSAASYDFENKYSIEYIFNHDIKLSEFPNIEIQTINPYNYLSSNGKTFDHDKVKTIFEGKFTSLQPLQKTA